MFRQLYDWIQNIAVYLIFVSAVMHAIPGKDYEKYIRFFSGLILILLLFTPLLNLTGMAEEFTSLYKSREYEMDRKEIEDAEEMFRNADLLDFVPEEYRGYMENEEDEENGGRIEVEEIRIGEE